MHESNSEEKKKINQIYWLRKIPFFGLQPRQASSPVLSGFSVVPYRPNKGSRREEKKATCEWRGVGCNLRGVSRIMNVPFLRKRMARKNNSRIKKTMTTKKGSASSYKKNQLSVKRQTRCTICQQATEDSHCGSPQKDVAERCSSLWENAELNYAELSRRCALVGGTGRKVNAATKEGKWI